MRGRPGRRQSRQRQILDRDPPPASGAGGHGDLERCGMPELAPSGRAPREGEVAFLRAKPRPAGRRREIAPHGPPDVLPGGVDQLDLEVVRSLFAAEREGELPVLRQIGRHLAPRRRPPGMPAEVEVQAQGPPTIPLCAGERELDAGRRKGPPQRNVPEVVPKDRPFRRGRREEKERCRQIRADWETGRLGDWENASICLSLTHSVPQSPSRPVTP